MVERLLASNQAFDKNKGVRLAQMFCDDAPELKLAALATDSEFAFRERAIRALAFNRTEEGVNTLKALLKEPAPEISKLTEKALRDAYTARNGARGKPLQANDFDANLQQPNNPLPK